MAVRLTLVYRQCQVHLSGVRIFSTSATITKHMAIPECRDRAVLPWVPGQPQLLPARRIPRKILMQLLPPTTPPTWQQHVHPTRRIFSKRCKKPSRSGVLHSFISSHHAHPVGDTLPRNRL